MTTASPQPEIRDGKVYHPDGTEAWPDGDGCTCKIIDAAYVDGDLQVLFTLDRDCVVHG